MFEKGWDISAVATQGGWRDWKALRKYVHLKAEHLAEKFRKADAVVLGVSKDDVKSHEKFVNKYNLDVRLLSDVDGSLCRSYGVWVEKNMYGRKYMGIERSTFLVDKKGVVRELWRKVKVGGHAQSVLDAVLRENN